jgi:hypothetical protein
VLENERSLTKKNPLEFIWEEYYMLQTIKGIYKNGIIELAETPQGITESLVFVTFLETERTTWPEIIIQHQGVADSIIFESYRDELLPPQAVEF